MKITIEQIEMAGYTIQRDGLILNTRGKPFKPRLNSDGYDVVSFRIAGKTVQKLRHRVIAMKYLPRPKGCLVVNHKDKDKLNCAVDNLEWETQSGNMLHAHDSPAYKRSTKDNIRLAKELRGEGLTLHNIASELGTSYVSVWRWLQTHHL